MIRHLRWLTRPTPGVAPGALALAVYAQPNGERGYQYHAAQESGYEGVACLDDVARAAALHCRIWRCTGEPYAARYARGYLAFVRGMQEDDGRFINFISDWSGTRNRYGPTSFAGGGWWTARALSALATGYATFRDPVDAAAFRHGVQWLHADRLSAGQAAQGILALMNFWRTTGDPYALDLAAELAELVALQRWGAALVDEAEADHVHLWSRYQEIALYRVGLALHRTTYMVTAADSAEAVLVPAAIGLVKRTPTLPCEAGCVARVLNCLSAVTGSRSHRHLANRAVAWFTGQNAANSPIYDRAAGRFYDGIDPGPVMSRNAGAESNVEGALTLLHLWPLQHTEWSSCDR
jgi:hypothetical protein